MTPPMASRTGRVGYGEGAGGRDVRLPPTSLQWAGRATNARRCYERRSVLVPHFGQVTRILPLPRGTLSTVPQPLHLK